MPIPALPTPPTRSDPSSFNDRADAFLAALPAFVSAANALEQSLQMVATTGTSTSSLPIGTGSKSLMTQGSKAWAVGSFLCVVAAADPENYMICQVTGYNADTGHLVATAQGAFGSGTFNSWAISLSAPYQAPVDLEAAFQNWINSTYEVGDYIHSDGADPNDRYPWQTWTLIGAGQTLVNINAAVEAMDAVGKTLGEREHVLSLEELPAHGHPISNVALLSGGDSWRNRWTDATDAGAPPAELATGDAGGGQAHNNMQPSRVTRIWRRTA